MEPDSAPSVDKTDIYEQADVIRNVNAPLKNRTAALQRYFRLRTD